MQTSAIARTIATMEILDLRHLSSSDLRPLMESETRRWAQRMAWDYTTSAEMVLRYVDAKILPGYAAMEDGRASGYAFFVYEGSKGVIGDLFVAPDPIAGTGLGPKLKKPGDEDLEEKLLTHVIETLQQSPGVTRIEAQLLLHDEGSIVRPFMQNGFRRWTRLFMMKSLAEATPQAVRMNGSQPAAASLVNVEIRKWTEQDFQASAGVITASYRGHLDAEINDQYRGIAGSLRFLNNIVRFPGCGQFDPESSLVAIDRVTQTQIGLLLCSRVRSDVGHVTQVCVVPEHQGKGIGRALIAGCCRHLRKKKMSGLSLTVTSGNTPAVGLYERMGFTIEHKFDAFVWEQ